MENINTYYDGDFVYNVFYAIMQAKSEIKSFRIKQTINKKKEKDRTSLALDSETMYPNREELKLINNGNSTYDMDDYEIRKRLLDEKNAMLKNMEIKLIEECNEKLLKILKINDNETRNEAIRVIGTEIMHKLAINAKKIDDWLI